MKEKVGLGIAGMFAIALVVFFALGMIPLEVFAPIVTGALVWIYKDIEQERNLKRLKEFYNERIN
jgi:uncharacterized paraquat-inducible protein A